MTQRSGRGRSGKGHSIKQKVASTLQKDGYILLAGDAAHTHSSAFAQGMNTAAHDATNLIWKLAGTLKGWYKPGVLSSYASERRAAAQKLIDIDRAAAAAVSGDVPAAYENASLSAEEALQNILQANMSFNIGLGVSYEASMLNKAPTATNLTVGTRNPDALVYAPGPLVPIRIQTITHGGLKGHWSFLVFAGCHHITRQKVAGLRVRLVADGGMPRRWNHLMKLSTILIGNVNSAWDAFDGPAVGNLYFDNDSTAHGRYGIYSDAGAIVIVRPDGIVAFAAGLDELDQVEAFFDSICTSADNESAQ